MFPSYSCIFMLPYHVLKDLVYCLSAHKYFADIKNSSATFICHYFSVPWSLSFEHKLQENKKRLLNLFNMSHCNHLKAPSAVNCILKLNFMKYLGWSSFSSRYNNTIRHYSLFFTLPTVC